jgi:hypothetical protein
MIPGAGTTQSAHGLSDVLDELGNELLFLVRARHSSLFQSVQTVSGAQPASYSFSKGDNFFQLKRKVC